MCAVHFQARARSRVQTEKHALTARFPVFPHTPTPKNLTPIAARRFERLRRNSPRLAAAHHLSIRLQIALGDLRSYVERCTLQERLRAGRGTIRQRWTLPDDLAVGRKVHESSSAHLFRDVADWTAGPVYRELRPRHSPDDPDSRKLAPLETPAAHDANTPAHTRMQRGLTETRSFFRSHPTSSSSEIESAGALANMRGSCAFQCFLRVRSGRRRLRDGAKE